MTSFVQLLVSGVGMGCIYCLVAIEISMVFNASGLVNFSHDNFITLGSYFFAGTLILVMKFPVWLSILGALGFMSLFGLIAATGIFAPLSKMPSHIYVVMGTIMLSKILGEIMRIAWGPAPFNLGEFIRGSFHIGDVAIPKVYPVIIVVTLILLLGIGFMFRKTKIGIAMRCVAQDKTAAALMGINVRQNIALTVALSSAICCIIGILIIPIFNISLSMSIMIGLKGFSAGVVGGFGSIPGAIVGGLLIGVVESLYCRVGPIVYRDAVAFVLLIVFLLAKPTGIIPNKTVRR